MEASTLAGRWKLPAILWSSGPGQPQMKIVLRKFRGDNQVSVKGTAG